jgi:hypothetical protein
MQLKEDPLRQGQLTVNGFQNGKMVAPDDVGGDDENVDGDEQCGDGGGQRGELHHS